MLATAHAGCLVGIEAKPVQVEVRLGKDLPGMEVVGLPDRGVREARVRVRAALESEGFALPERSFVLNLAPGDLRKDGASFDLAIAVSLLVACDLARDHRLHDTLFVGELGLSGELRAVRGVLPQLRSAAARGLRRAIVPAPNQAEAALASGIEVLAARYLHEVAEWLDGERELPRVETREAASHIPSPVDLREVRGQPASCRGLEIAAAGGHHLLMIGPPGSGKTMLARRLPTLLPAPNAAELLEIASIASAAGLMPRGGLGRLGRPFRAPHHTASAVAIIGGGVPIRPGEVTLAHHGALFLDELPEFRRDAIETLRTVIESGEVVIARAHARLRMPARPLVIAAMNPCPCGHHGDPGRLCRCTPERIERYRGRISGPLLDRFDLHLHVPRVAAGAIRKATRAEPSAEVRRRVEAARSRAQARGRLNTEALLAQTEERAITLLDRAVEQLGLSARAYVKALRVGRTIADLEGADSVERPHLAEAIQYRLLDRREIDAGRGRGRRPGSSPRRSPGTPESFENTKEG